MPLRLNITAKATNSPANVPEINVLMKVSDILACATAIVKSAILSFKKVWDIKSAIKAVPIKLPAYTINICRTEYS